MGVISQYERVTHYPTYALARWYVNVCGFSVMPFAPRSKRRLFGGTVFQEWLPRDEHLQKWFCTPQVNNLGIVCGAISGNLCVLDFDEFGIYQHWISHIPAAYDLPCVRSARGVHVYVRLHTLPPGGEGSFDGLPFGQILTRGTITAPPSIHPSGQQYVWAGDPRHVPLFFCLADLSVEKVSEDRSISSVKPSLPKTPLAASGIRNQLAYAQAAIRYEGQKIVDVGQGRRNIQLYQAALKLSKYLDILTETQLEQELIHWAEAAGMQEGPADVIRDTIYSGLRNGCQHGVIRKG